MDFFFFLKCLTLDFFFFFLMWTIFEVFIAFVIILLLFYVFFFFFLAMSMGESELLNQGLNLQPSHSVWEGELLTPGPSGKSPMD